MRSFFLPKYILDLLSLSRSTLVSGRDRWYMLSSISSVHTRTLDISRHRVGVFKRRWRGTDSGASQYSTTYKAHANIYRFRYNRQIICRYCPRRTWPWWREYIPNNGRIALRKGHVQNRNSRPRCAPLAYNSPCLDDHMGDHFHP
jgi:hypothetical protein